MIIDSSMIISGFVSKVVNDCVDIIKDKIKNADKNRKSHIQNMETRIYQVTIDAINVFTDNIYEELDVLYDAAECILIGLKTGKNNIEAVRAGLKILGLQVMSGTCEDFLEALCYEICQKVNRDLAIEIIILQQEQTNGYIQEGFRRSYLSDEEINRKLDYLIKELINKKVYEKRYNIENIIENRAEEYAGKWNKNVFLNNFKKRDKNKGENVKLKELYLEKLLLHYKWKADDDQLDDIRDLLREYIIDRDDKKMLLILGQPGIGKSTLITWIMATLVEKKDDILVYQFANDLGSINWQGGNVLNDIFKVIGLEYDELENKTLILDGFDEINIGSDRERILNKLNQELIRRNILKNFSLIITCRQNYIYNLQKIECDYITLQAWNETQIETFCRTYWKKCGNKISEFKIQKILENEEIFGIPLILYMILALDVDIENGSSKMDIFDQVFSLKRGGIYDRCYDTEHRINSPEIKKHIHQISQRIAFWIFENNDAKACISQEKFIEICEEEMRKSGERGEEIHNDTFFGNFFKLKHCEGKGTDELQFVHRSIYEYFVVIYFFESVHKLSSKEEVAEKLGELLKDGRLSKQILEFIKYKFESIEGYSLSDITKEVFNIMLRDGMTYYVKEKYKNIIVRETNIFFNMLEVVHLWNPKLGRVNDNIFVYLQSNHMNMLKLIGAELMGAYLVGAYLVEADLKGACLRVAYLSKADLSRANLRGADLRGADLRGADLKGADLSGADLSEADLSQADLKGADLGGAYLTKTIFDEKKIDDLCGKYNINNSRVYMSKTKEIITYKEYSLRKKRTRT